MTDVLFYHLQNMTVEKVLPPLVEKSIERGWRVVVQTSSDERVDALDTHLWTYRDDSFLPHATARAPDAAEQPVLLTTDADNPNGAQVRFLVDNAQLPEDVSAYERVVLVFDGDDDAALAQARAAWTASKSRGHDVTYWQADERGRWQRRGIANASGA
jgi:DNA polymerase-3 subunit chi